MNITFYIIIFVNFCKIYIIYIYFNFKSNLNHGNNKKFLNLKT